MEIRILIIITYLFVLVALIFFISGFFIEDKKLIKTLWRLYFSEFVIIGLILIPAYLGHLPFLTALIFIGTISIYEIYKQSIPKSPLLSKYVMYAASPFFCLAAFNDEQTLFKIFIFFIMILFVIEIFNKNKGDQFNDLAKAVFILLYPCLFITYLILLRHLPKGFLLVAFFYFISEIHDTFALIVGKLIGKTKIFPVLSPNKTYEGVFGGILCTLIFGIIFNHLITKFSLKSASLAIFIIIITTILGDLTASKIKRSLNIKDFGSVFKVQGGMMDIYDAVIFSAPLFYWYAEKKLL